MRFIKSYRKFAWSLFTTVRLRSTAYRVGKTYTCTVPDGECPTCHQTKHRQFRAKVIARTDITLDDITDELAQKDADCDAETLKLSLRFWYGPDAELVLLTLEKVQPDG